MYASKKLFLFSNNGTEVRKIYRLGKQFTPHNLHMEFWNDMTWRISLRVRTVKTGLEILNEHYSNIKPTLMAIKTKNLKSKLQKITDSKIILKSSVRKSCETLFSQPRLPANREAFFKSLDNRYPDIPRLNTFRHALNRTTAPHSATQPMEATNSASEYFVQHSPEVQQYVLTFVDTPFEEHPEFEKTVSFFSQHLFNASSRELETLLDISQTYEHLALVLSEFYIIYIVGTVAFIKILVPLHQKGAFSLLVEKSVQKQQNFRDNCYRRLYQRLAQWQVTMQPVVTPIVKVCLETCYPYIQGTLFGYFYRVGILPMLYYLSSRPPAPLPRPEVHVVRDVVDRVFSNSSRGLNNSFIDRATDLASRALFELGRSVSTIGGSFVRGVLSTHEETAQDAAARIDQELTDRARSQQNNNLRN